MNKNDKIPRMDGFFEILFRRPEVGPLENPEEFDWDDYHMVLNRLPAAEFDSVMKCFEAICEAPFRLGSLPRPPKPGDVIHWCEFDQGTDCLIFLITDKESQKILDKYPQGFGGLGSERTNGLLISQVPAVMPSYYRSQQRKF